MPFPSACRLDFRLVHHWSPHVNQDNNSVMTDQLMQRWGVGPVNLFDYLYLGIYRINIFSYWWHRAPPQGIGPFLRNFLFCQALPSLADWGNRRLLLSTGAAQETLGRSKGSLEAPAFHLDSWNCTEENRTDIHLNPKSEIVGRTTAIGHLVLKRIETKDVPFDIHGTSPNFVRFFKRQSAHEWCLDTFVPGRQHISWWLAVIARHYWQLSWWVPQNHPTWFRENGKSHGKTQRFGVPIF